MSVKKYGITLEGQEYIVEVREIKEDILRHIYGLSKTEFIQTGSQIKPEVLTDNTVVLDRDYTITYGENTNVGFGTVEIEGINNYSGNTVLTFEIIKDVIAFHIEGLEHYEYQYTGEAIEPVVITDGTVLKDTDYEVEYLDNIEMGAGSVNVIGKGKYEGTNTNFIFNIIPGVPNTDETPSTDEEPENNGESETE